jgi:hypothetical protein
MSPERSHQCVFYETALPAVFHETPEDFLYYLERDGNKFLLFYWEQVAKSITPSDRGDSYGINFIIHRLQSNVTIAMVLLPAPQRPDEAYYEAFVYRPRRVTPILRISDMTTVYALVLVSPPGELPRTSILEYTKKVQSLNHGDGPEPVVEDFYRSVLELLRDSRGSL